MFKTRFDATLKIGKITDCLLNFTSFGHQTVILKVYFRKPELLAKLNDGKGKSKDFVTKVLAQVRLPVIKPQLFSMSFTLHRSPKYPKHPSLSQTQLHAAPFPNTPYTPRTSHPTQPSLSQTVLLRCLTLRITCSQVSHTQNNMFSGVSHSE